ncbi:MAG: DinB family protein [Verrucomicrobia bacterium]|nr:DinB family protein [Verrucomicrobiota bacterium]
MQLIRSVLFLAGLSLALGAQAADQAFEAAFRTSLLKSFNEASGKILALAEAIPEERYAWRPMEGVSSVREVLVHVADTNFSLGARLGGKPPSGVDRKALVESMKTKAEALAVAKLSMDYIRDILGVVPASELLPEVNVFGSKAPKLRVALLPVDHAHEHLGQLIAYARMNRVVPPWSK